MTANVLFSLIATVFFAAAAPALAASDPADACKASKAKAAGKKAASLLKAYGKNTKKPDGVKLGAGVSKAQSKFTKSFVKAESKGGCLTTGDVTQIEATVDAFVQMAVASVNESVCGDGVAALDEECDGDDAAACEGLCQVNCKCPVPICANGVLESGEECDPPCSTGPCGGGQICGVQCACVPADPCDCGMPEPATLEFASTVPSGGIGICGAVKDGADTTLRDLECGSSYAGGGDIAVDAQGPVHIGTETVYKVECCYGKTLALTATTAADTGSNRNCSSAGCTPGGPNPFPMGIVPLTTCLVDTYDEDVFGWADCETGEVALREVVRTSLYLTGDELLTRCSGGANPGGACEDDTDCTPGGTCEADVGAFVCVGGSNDGNTCFNPFEPSECPGGTCEATDIQACPICNTATMLCNGGPNDGLSCMPETADLGDPYPTTHDCPPDPFNIVGNYLVPHNRSTDPVQSKATTDGQFCTFCRDVFVEGSNCFEGDHALICPDSATGPCKPQSAQISECGTPTPCETDADCIAPYETCTQRTPGALDFPNGLTIETSGMPAGDLTDGLPHAARLTSLSCIPPSFISFEDANADFPAPTTASLVGPVQLKP